MHLKQGCQRYSLQDGLDPYSHVTWPPLLSLCVPIWALLRMQDPALAVPALASLRLLHMEMATAGSGQAPLGPGAGTACNTVLHQPEQAPGLACRG